MRLYFARYWIPVEAKSAQTGETRVREHGPFCVSIPGCALREVSEEEIVEHCRGIHGVEPMRIERSVLT